jgi:hypothetical protein
VKFVTLRIPVTVLNEDGLRVNATHVDVRALVPDDEHSAETAKRFGEALEKTLNTVDIGDCT